MFKIPVKSSLSRINFTTTETNQRLKFSRKLERDQSPQTLVGLFSRNCATITSASAPKPAMPMFWATFQSILASQPTFTSFQTNLATYYGRLSLDRLQAVRVPYSSQQFEVAGEWRVIYYVGSDKVRHWYCTVSLRFRSTVYEGTLRYLNHRRHLIRKINGEYFLFECSVPL